MKTILGLQQPVVGLAPIDGISDRAFREITKKYSNPDIMFTEFTHVMGLCMAAQNTLEAFDFSEMERPIVAQIYGAEPKYFYHAAKLVCALGFDGVDINMGCPAKNVAASGAGAALIKTPDLAREIIYETKRGVADWVVDGKLTGMKGKALKAALEMIERNRARIAVGLSLQTGGLEESHPSDQRGFWNLTHLEDRKPIPVSVKTRIGFYEVVTESWVQNLTKADPDWITIHGRTLKQLYSGISDWDQLKIAVESTDIPVMTNGDVKVYEDIARILNHTGGAGALVARATFGNPWFFQQSSVISKQLSDNNLASNELTTENRKLLTTTMLEHARLFTKYHPEPGAFVMMRKHFGWYAKGFDGAKDLRAKLVRINSIEELEEILA